MKTLILMILGPLLVFRACAQQIINDEAVRYQAERMVYKQWDQNKFLPKKGFLSLNPYYWLTWGLFEPSYHKKDLRPLSALGPQTQRLALVGTMNSVDNSYKLHSDTVRNTALTAIAEQSGLVSGADPLWLLYYSKTLKPVTDFNDAALLASLPNNVRSAVVREGIYDWYRQEMAMLKERVNGARNADMDRGSRIMAFYRYLKEYRSLSATWENRVATASKNMAMVKRQRQGKNDPASGLVWTRQTDVQIANRVLTDRKY